VVIKVAAGAMTSYVLSSSGNIYQFGLIHKGDEVCGGAEDGRSITDDADSDDAASGQLTGMAQSAETVYVHADTEARLHSAAMISASGSDEGSRITARAQVRELNDIVVESRQRFSTASEYSSIHRIKLSFCIIISKVDAGK